MIINGELSLSQQKKGRQGLLIFSFLNGLALTCVTGNVLSIYLLKLGCIPAFIAAISSFSYLGTLFTFAGKSSMSKFGASSTIKYSWLICCFTIMILAFIPFFNSIHYSKVLIPLLIVSSCFLFFIFKSIGTAALQPLMGEVTTKENQGSFSSRFFLFYSSATIIAIAAVFSLISISNSLYMFQVVIFAGSFIFLAGSCIFLRIKETEAPSKSAREKTSLQLFSTIWQNQTYRHFLYARSLGRSALILIIPVSILALVKMYNISDSIALLFAIIQLGGGIFITYFNGIISEETGPKPLIIIYIILLFIICIFWILAPKDIHWGYCSIIFFTGGICLYGLDSCLNHYYLTIIPRENSAGISLWYTTICGAVAGISGLIFGGGLIKILSKFIPYTDLFRYYYTVMFIFMIPVLYLMFKLKSTSNWTVSEVISLAFSPNELHSLRVLQSIQKYSTVKDEFSNVLKLQGLNSNFSEETLIYYLKSPLYFVRLSALRALNSLTIGEKTKQAVFNELKNGEYSTAYLAAIILARNKLPESIPLLREYLDCEDIHLKANSMIALASMKDEKSYAKIIKIFKESTNPRIITNGAMAFQIMKDKATVGLLLEKTTLFYNSKNKQKEFVLDELICAIADIYGFFNVFYKALRIFSDNFSAGILNLLESVDKEKTSEFGTTVETTIKDFLEKKISHTIMVEFIIKAINKDKKNELQDIHDFLLGIDVNKVSGKLLVCIFIILFFNKDKE